MSHLTNVVLIAAAQPPHLDKLALFGFAAAVALIVCWTIPFKTTTVRLATMGCQLALATYGFLAGTWPIGIVLLVAAMGNLRHIPRFRKGVQKVGWYALPHHPRYHSARLGRLFGAPPDASARRRRHGPGDDDALQVN